MSSAALLLLHLVFSCLHRQLLLRMLRHSNMRGHNLLIRLCLERLRVNVDQRQGDERHGGFISRNLSLQVTRHGSSSS